MSGLRHYLRGLSLVAAMGAVFLLDPPAHADPARARAHFEMARRYFQIDEYRKAIEEFKAAHVEEPDPAFLYNIAECHRHLSETKDALVFYRRFLTLAPPAAASRANAEKRIAELQGLRPAPVPAAPVAAAPIAAAPPPPPPPEPPPVVASSLPMAAHAQEPMPESSVTLAASPEASNRPAADSRPFYKSGWFYVVLGGALVAGTVGVWALSSNGKTTVPETPLGNQSVFP